MQETFHSAAAPSGADGPQKFSVDPSLSRASANGSLMRGLKIMEAIADAPSPMPLVDIAECIQLDSSTVYRLLQLLCQAGYVIRLRSKRYCAGPRSICLLAHNHPVNRFCGEVEGVLHELRDRLGETITLILFVGHQRVIVKIVQGREILSQSYQTWLRTPLHGSASGKIILMFMPPTELRELLGSAPYPAATEFTVTDEATLLRNLANARNKGYAVARDDAFVGMTAIAAPFICSERPLGCLAIIGSSARILPSADDILGGALRETANLIGNVMPSLRNLEHCFSR